MLRLFKWHIDPIDRLVVPAGLISAARCRRGFASIVRARANATQPLPLTLSATIVFAAGLWATLFAAMLALHPAVPLAQQLGVTLLSVLAALAIGWPGLAAAPRFYRFARAHAARWNGATGVPLARDLGRLAKKLSLARSAAGGLAAASLLAVAIWSSGPSPDPAMIRTGPAPIMLLPNILPGAASDASAMLTRPARPSPLVPRQTSATARQAIAGAAGLPSSARDITALVTEIATAQRIDPRLVLAIIATESAFQADAVSAGNAQGLMQLTPETARRFGARNLLNPAENIAAGTKYLRWLLAYFEGDLSLALAGYNAGEGAVLRYGGVPPFPETQLYLRKIRSLYPAERHPFEQLALR